MSEKKVGPKEAMIRAMREKRAVENSKNCLQKPGKLNDKKKRIAAAIKAAKRISLKTRVANL